MLYRIHAGTTTTREYAWGEVKAAALYERMCVIYGESNLYFEVYNKKRWVVIKGRQKAGY